MALVGTISGSNGTSNTAISGTLVIANTPTGFPRIPGDATLFVSGGLDGTGRTVIGGDLVSSGTIRCLYSAGDEGGEIFLTGSVTSTTITNGVTIDVYQNRLRFFEQGGSTRGYYVDITAGAAGVGTNLVMPVDMYAPIFGDGADGDVTINTGGVTLSKEMYYNNLTITSTGELKPAGFRIFVKGTLTIASGGSINDDGIPGGGGGTTNGGGALGTRGYLGAGAGAGGAGRSTTGAGGNAAAAPGNCSPNAAGLAPRGGAGGSAGGANTGGASGTNAFAPFQQKWISQAFLFSGRQTGGQFGGGSGGGGGGADVTGGGGSSGGGGGGAGIVWIAANSISNSGIISARGGTGANSTSSGGITGGGGGGGGGLVAITTRSTAYGTVSATGGAGGSGAGGGATGVVGIDGVVAVRVVP